SSTSNNNLESDINHSDVSNFHSQKNYYNNNNNNNNNNNYYYYHQGYQCMSPQSMFADESQSDYFQNNNNNNNISNTKRSFRTSSTSTSSKHYSINSQFRRDSWSTVTKK